METMDTRKTRVLIVEDEAIVAMDLSGGLQQLGYEVVGAVGTAADALRLAELSPPDIALLDIRLQGASDGIDVAAALYARLRIPIIFLTADTNQATLARALGASPAGYLTKPIGTATLRTTIEVALRNAKNSQAASELRDSLREQSLTDPLTGLYNRRHFDAALARELELAARKAHPVSLIMLDLDDFKALNDMYGLRAGDAALAMVASSLRARLRCYDIACRIGGDELAIIVPGAGFRAASVLAEQLQTSIKSVAFLHEMRTIGPLSFSAGVASYPAQAGDAHSLVRSADEALHIAKRSHRVGGS